MENFTIFLRLSSQPFTLKFRQKSDSILRFKMPKTTPCFWIRRPSRCCLDHNLDFFRNRLTFFLFIDSLNSSFVQFCGWMVTGYFCRDFFESWNLLNVCFFGKHQVGLQLQVFVALFGLIFCFPAFRKAFPAFILETLWQEDVGRDEEELCTEGWLVDWLFWLVDWLMVHDF